MRKEKIRNKWLYSLSLCTTVVVILISLRDFAFGEEYANNEEYDQVIIRNSSNDLISSVSGGAIQTEESLLNNTSKESDFVIDDNGVLLSYLGNEEHVRIPDGVYEIRSHAFFENKSIKSVYIPSGVKLIVKSAFLGCSNLNTLVIPAYLYYGNGDAFPEQIDHKFIVYNQGSDLMDYIGIGGEVVIPNWISGIGLSAFIYEDAITGITIPDSVKTISSNAFYGCINLANIVIPESVSFIGAYAFGNCNSLTNITIPSGVKKIEYNTFEYCEKLTSVTIPDGVSDIETLAFNGCESLENLIIPNSVKNIGGGAFKNCSNLVSVTFAGDVHASAFWGCKNLADVKILSGAKTIGYFAFAYCEKLTNVIIEDSITIISDGAFRNCYSLSNIELPPSLKYIGPAVFSGCENLDRIEIPSGVRTIANLSLTQSVTIFGTTGSTAELYANIYKHPFIPIRTSIIIYDNQTGAPITGAEVIINDISYITDNKGSIEVAPGILDTLIINKEGYDSHVINEFAIDTLEIYPIGLNPTVTFDSNEYIKTVMLQGIGKNIAFSSNIMIDEASFFSNTEEKSNITIDAYLGDKEVSKYLIINDGILILENNTDVFLDVDMSMFKPGSQTFSYIEFADGTRCKKVELLIRNYEVIR